MPDREIDIVFGSVLRALRKRRGLTQEELAEEADLHRTYIGLLEVGKRSPSLRTLGIICDCLQIRLGEMMVLVDAGLEEVRQEQTAAVDAAAPASDERAQHRG